jgi:hypothetical protein
MNKTRRRTWPDLVVSGEADPASLSRAVSRGRLRRLGVGIYTSLVDEDPAQVVRRHWVRILQHVFPEAVIADRSVRWGGPDPDGLLTVVHRRWRPLELPGLTVRPRRGGADARTDTRFAERLWMRSPARTMLDSLAGRGERYLTQAELEAWIGQIIETQGEDRINRIRDEGREIANVLDREAAFGRLDRMIAAALTTGDASDLVSSDLIARAMGQAVDGRRLRQFEALASELGRLAPDPLPALPADQAQRALLPFYEAYFSNFIEGTEFTVDEAAAIVFEHRIPAERPADAHDIIGTYRVVSDDALMRETPATAEELIDMLSARHAVILEGRPESDPGRFKTRPNRAGGTLFVMPDAVEGTLRAGFEMARPLIDPFARATYLMFLVSEVHPFTDGNGRVARVMMNGELVHGGEVRLIVPTVYRNNYLAALKAATNNATFEALIAVLRFAQRYTARIDFSTRDSAERDLGRTNAFRDPNEADAYGIRLQLP